MDLRRVRLSDVLTGLLGAALVGLLWAPWYHAPASFNAWQAMAADDVIFCIGGLLGVWVLVATATNATGAVPVSAAVFASFGGMVVSVLAVIRLIWPPDLGPGPTDRAAGVWLGAAAAIGLMLSALRTMHEERRGVYSSLNVPVTKLPAPRVGERGSDA